MRVLLGLAALAAAASSVNAQTGVNLNSAQAIGNQQGVPALYPNVGQNALAQITVYATSTSGTVASATSAPTITLSPLPPAGLTPTNNYAIYVANTISTVVFQFQTDAWMAQMQYRWQPNYPDQSNNGANGLPSNAYTCDICCNSVGDLSPSSQKCNTQNGPGTSAPAGLPAEGNSPSVGFSCANLNRFYWFNNLVASVNGQAQFANKFQVEVYDNIQPLPNTSSYSFTIVRIAPPIIGDPQIYGLQGQDFQVHGVPDEIFNMITYPNLQVNARFSYLSSGDCVDNYTACFAHPGTYISEEGIRLGSDKIHVRAGSARKGLTVAVNGKKLAAGKQDVKLGSVAILNHRRVVISTPIMAITLTNSDKFLNQETALLDQKLLALGSERRVLGDAETFHSEVPLHGLQGQTWRNVEYPSGLEYEGTISDYQVTDGNLFGTSFVFNQFSQ